MGTRALPAVPAFPRFVGATAAANLADGLYLVVLPLLAVQLTDSPALVAGVTLAMTLPWALFGLPAGALADRLDRRRVIVAAHTLRWVALGVVTFAWVAGVVSLPALYALAFILGTAETLADTAAAAMPPALVPREQLGSANAVLSTVQTIGNSFGGPALAGLLVALSAAAALGASAALYLVAAIAVTSIAGRFRAANRAPTGMWAASMEGIGYLWRHRVLRPLTISTAAMNLLWGGWTATFVLLAVAPGPLRLSTTEYGLLMTGLGIGGVTGSVAAPWLERRLGLRGALTVDFVGTTAFFALPLTGHPLAAGAGVVLAGFGSAVWIVLNATLRQRIVPDELLSRTYGAHRLISWGVLPIGAGLGGFGAQVLGVTGLFATGAVLGAVLLAGWLTMPFPIGREDGLDRMEARVGSA